jgi:choline dehydrogenase-like flavoprotein
VIVLESGSFERQSQVDALNDIENVGWPRNPDQWSVRNRVVGGSSHTWAGRCAPFDEIDFEYRDWVPYSGWPFRRESLEPYFDRAAPYLGLGVGSGFSDERFWHLSGLPPPRPDVDPSKLLPFFWQYSRDEQNAFDSMRFGPRMVAKLGANVTLVTNATVRQINPTSSVTAVESVDVVSTSGRRLKLSTSLVILCAGGIENARLLLNSDSIVKPGLGNPNDLVGRFLMDHPRGSVGAFRIDGSLALQKRFGLYFAKDSTGGHLFQHGLRLSPQIQREEKLLNCAVWLGKWVTPDDPWDALKRISSGRFNLSSDMIAVASNFNLLVRGLRNYLVTRNMFFTRFDLPRKLERLNLDCMCEQRPDPESRVTLSEGRDRFGMRLPRVDWRVHADEYRTMQRMAELAAAELSRLGFGSLTLEAWVRNREQFPTTVLDAAHPTGTTRMAESPSHGVVDAQCQVHGVHGLYVAGSSVFPTTSHCNPTQMIVALAIRLADRLKLKFAAGKTVPSHP